MTVVAPVVHALYSYEMDDRFGPPRWSEVVVDNNQCGGKTQSPIAIDFSKCTKYANYRFKVCVCVCLYCAFLFIIWKRTILFLIQANVSLIFRYLFFSFFNRKGLVQQMC